MPDKLTLPRFLKVAYTSLDAGPEPYNEEYSTKHLLESSSNSSSTDELPPYRPRRSINLLGKFFIAANVLLFLVSAFLLFFSTRLARSTIVSGDLEDKFNNSLIKLHSGPSPILDQKHISISTVQRNGSFVALDTPSVWRQGPSEAVDHAWNRIATLSPIPLSSNDVELLGGNSSDTARFPPIFGLGGDAHIGRLDVFHLIHCLDALRREVWFDHYYSKKYPNGPDDAHYVHVTHCISMLLQNIMCNAPLTPILHYWVDTAQEPSPNFSDNHQCRDFDTVMAWQEEKSVDLKYYRSIIRRPDDVIPKEMPEAYKQLIGFKPQKPTS